MNLYTPAIAYGNHPTAKLQTGVRFLRFGRDQVRDRSMMGELITSIVYCNWDDDLGFDVTFLTDVGRQKAIVDYAATENVESGEGAAGQPHFRRFVEVVPSEGMYGTEFQALIEKVIADDGNWNYYGIDFKVIPHKELTPEFTGYATTAIADGW